MNPVKSIFLTIRNSVKRFPAMYLFAVLASVFSSIYFICESLNNYTSAKWTIPFILDFGWFIIFSYLVKFLFEKYFVQSKKNAILSFFIPILLSIPCYFFCESYETFAYFPLIYFATSFAEILFCGSCFYENAKEKNGANLFLSSMISGIVCACVATSLTIIVRAFRYLIFEFDENLMVDIILSIWVSSSFIIFIGLFVSYSSKNYGEIAITMPFKVVFLYALFPLYIVLVAVLYAYIFKSVFTLSLPTGKLNPFVSTATLIFVIFYLTLQIYENKFVKFFVKFGGIFMIPLIITQIIAFFIRVNAYGLTQTRYASLLYIIFSLVFVLFSIFNNFKKINLQKYAYSILACFFIFACLPKVNLIDVSENSMKNNIEKIYKSHNLFDESTGKFITKDAGKIFSSEEKNLISSSSNEIKINLEKISWAELDYDGEWADGKKVRLNFEKTFGFKYHWNYDYEDEKVLGIKFSSHSKDIVFDISDYSKLHEISNLNLRKIYDSNLETDIETFYVETRDGLEFSVTDEIKSQLSMIARYGSAEKRAPYIFDIQDGKYRVIFTSVNIYEEDYKSSESYYCYADGYILEK